MEVDLLDIEVTNSGTIVEIMRVVDLKDAASPKRLLVKEWIDERHYRDVEVGDELWALYPGEPWCQGPPGTNETRRIIERRSEKKQQW